MYIAMNRFKVKLGEEEAFEKIWRQRESYLDDVNGFKEFHLLRGPSNDEYTLYASHSRWDSHEVFEKWTKSEKFRKAHAQAGASKPVYLSHPQFEGFEVVL